MKKIILILLSLFSFYISADEVKDAKISDITVEQLTDIVRQIVQETIEKCIVLDRAFRNGKTHYVLLDYGCLTYRSCPSSGACVFLYNVDGMSCC